MILARRDSGELSQAITSTGQASLTSSGARLALSLLAPPSLVRVRSPSRPPGFGAVTPPPSSAQASTPFSTPMSSPMASQLTPLFFTDGPLIRTPPSPRARADPLATNELFVDCNRAILGTPPSSPPHRRPVNRRKTLAGMDVCRTYGFSLRRASTRIKARRKAAPIAQKAQAMVCQNLGIIRGGQVVTEQALAEFARRFEGEVPLQVIAALRALFKLDDPEDVDDALIASGGAGALDMEADAEINNVSA